MTFAPFFMVQMTVSQLFGESRIVIPAERSFEF